MSNMYREGFEKGSKDNIILNTLANLLLLFPIAIKHIVSVLCIYRLVTGTVTKQETQTESIHSGQVC